jgi:ABC-type transporter Mla subunit MlaD
MSATLSQVNKSLGDIVSLISSLDERLKSLDDKINILNENLNKSASLTIGLNEKQDEIEKKLLEFLG